MAEIKSLTPISEADHETRPPPAASEADRETRPPTRSSETDDEAKSPPSVSEAHRGTRSATPISEADYEAIEAAVMETERGRWFLREYSRRNRTADTQVLLDAIGRLEQAVAGERVAQDVDRLRGHLKEMATAIRRTKSEIAVIHAVEKEHSHLFAASEALDSITRQTEQATSDILAAAENIQESAWTLREEGANAALCDDLDRRATDIYTACSFQDLTAQRIAKIVQTLRYLEGRINAMIAIWDGTEAPFPTDEAGSDSVARSDAPDELDLTQSDIDSVIIGGDLFGSGIARAEAALQGPDEPGIAPAAAAAIPQGEDEPGFAEAPSREAQPELAADPEPVDEPVAPAEIPEVTVVEVAASPLGKSEPQAGIAPLPQPSPPEAPFRVEAFVDIDRLPTRERLRLFS